MPDAGASEESPRLTVGILDALPKLHRAPPAASRGDGDWERIRLVCFEGELTN